MIFLLETRDTSIRRSEDIESLLEVSVLSIVPIIYQQKDLKKQKFNLAFSIFSIILSFVLLVGFAILTLKGVDQTINLVNKFFT